MKKNKGCITCAVGCGVLVILGITLLISISIWMNQKGEFDQNQSILTNEADFYVQLKLGEEEQALVEFIQGLTTRSNSNNPVFKKFPMLKGLANKDAGNDIRKLLPLRIEVQGNPVDDMFQVSVGFSVYNRIASVVYFFMKKNAKNDNMLFMCGDKPYIKYVDKKQEPVLISLFDNTIYVASDKAGMEQMLSSPISAQESHVESMALMELNLGQPAYGYLTRSAVNPDTLSYFGLAETMDWSWFNQDVISNVSWDLGIGSDRESLSGKMLLELTDPSQAAFLEEKLESLKSELEGATSFEGGGHAEISLNWEQTTSGFMVHFEVKNMDLPNNSGNIVNIKQSKSIED